MSSEPASPLAQLLERDVDRREFLAYGASLALAILGVTQLLHSLSSTHPKQLSNQPGGYGSSPYGGTR